MKKDNLISLKDIIQKKIRIRIIICIVITFMIPISQVIIDVASNFKSFRVNLNATCASLADFTESQALVGNDFGAELNLSKYNNEQDKMHVDWVKNKSIEKADFLWNFPFDWSYDYPLRNIGKNSFGYFHITGKVSFSKSQIYDFIQQSCILLLFSTLIFIILYPIAKQIPRKFFVYPISDVLRLLSNKSFDDFNSYKNQVNILEIREIEDSIINLLKQVDKTNKLEKQAAMGDIAAQVAHDIRSPLATINVIVKESNELEEQKRIILRNATQQLNDIANVLLVKYRLKDDSQSSKNDYIKNSEVIAVLLDLMVSEKRLQCKHLPISIDFNVETDARGAFAHIVISDFKRVISNIINNAIESINGRGEIKINLSISETTVNIEIKDSGIGMTPELIEKVFDGSITSNKKEGSGIGLVSSYQLIRSWGGDLKIESQLNQGTTIYLSFALLDSAPWFAANLSFIQGSKIIVLDDDQSIHDLWNSRFSCEISSANLRVQHFYQANELMQLDYNELKSSYFLCDYELIGQDKTGLDVIEKMNLSNSATLVTSRYDDKEIRRRCAELNIKILPKNYAAYVPICIIENNLSNLSDENQPDIILIDDDHLVINTWKFIAKKKNKIILTFDNFSDAEKGIERLSRTIPIYIDSNLGTKISGEECAKILSNKGFINLYLATGHNPSRFGAMPWIRAIVGKEPPF